LLAASLVVAAIDAGALGFEVRFDVVRFEVVRFDEARFDAVRFGVGDETLLVAVLLAVLLVRLLATANPVSGALADCAAAVVASLVASNERARGGAVSGVAEPDVADGSAVEILRRAELTALGLIGAGLIGTELMGAEPTGAELPGVELLTLESLDWGVAGCLAVAGSVRGARLFSLTGDCSVGIGSGAGVNAGIGAEDAGETTLEIELVEGTAPWLRADKATGCSEEVLRTEVKKGGTTEDGSAFVSGVAGVGSAGLNEAAGTDGDRTVGDWSSAKIVAPAGIGA
jgi:hypothetical protein